MSANQAQLTNDCGAEMPYQTIHYNDIYWYQMMYYDSKIQRPVSVQDVLPNVDNDIQVYSYACLRGMQETGRAARDSSLARSVFVSNWPEARRACHLMKKDTRVIKYASWRPALTRKSAW